MFLFCLCFLFILIRQQILPGHLNDYVCQYPVTDLYDESVDFDPDDIFRFIYIF